MNAAAPRILCAGRVYCDLVFTGLAAPPEPGHEVFAGGLALRAGGGAYITAAYLSALGMEAELFAMLPGPPFDALVRDELAANRIAADFCRTGDGADPQVTVAMVTARDRAFLTRRTGPALPGGIAAALARATHLHIGELATLLEYPDLARMARDSGLTVSLDCGWDDAALARPGLAALIAEADLFLPNAAEAERLGRDATAAALTVVKRGAAGAEARRGAERIAAPAEPVEAVDSTGAGDAFNAGFLSGWLTGRPLDACLAAGNACGAFAVTRIGGAGILPDLRHLSGAGVPRVAVR